MIQKIRIISRNSALAMWQAQFVRDRLVEVYPHLSVEIIGVTTKGDQILDRSLDKIGGKGLFIKELEHGLLNDIADIAVHSLKDLSANIDPQFKIAAILARGEASDVLVSNKYTRLDEMPHGSIIGTSSARRIALLKKYYPHLTCKLLRGNLNTRIKKLDENEYDGIILAAIGLERLGLDHRITQKLDKTKFIPAIGQGALAIEVLSTRHDLDALLAPLIDVDTTITVSAEREVGRMLGANCSIPLAAHATLDGEDLHLNALFVDLELDKYYYASIHKPKDKFQEAGLECASALIKSGATATLT